METASRNIRQGLPDPYQVISVALADIMKSQPGFHKIKNGIAESGRPGLAPLFSGRKLGKEEQAHSPFPGRWWKEAGWLVKKVTVRCFCIRRRYGH
jgi:hypothetical protein